MLSHESGTFRHEMMGYKYKACVEVEFMKGGRVSPLVKMDKLVGGGAQFRKQHGTTNRPGSTRFNRAVGDHHRICLHAEVLQLWYQPPHHRVRRLALLPYEIVLVRVECPSRAKEYVTGISTTRVLEPHLRNGLCPQTPRVFIVFQILDKMVRTGDDAECHLRISYDFISVCVRVVDLPLRLR